ncbi:MAG: beta-ketoacyl-ACP synthase II [Candidatus Hydrogenedentes bacterium]|nr:beta-ketoacyl-ACP synthase II [Candidatus Hydrogenedentota bacterium]
MPADMNAKDIRRRDRFTLFALYASDQAWAQSGLGGGDDESQLRYGCIFGSGIGGLNTIEEQHSKFLQDGPRRISPLMIPKLLSNMAAGEVAIRLGLRGPNKAVVTACASGTQSIGEAMQIIRHNLADVMVAGGSEASIVPFGIAGFSAIRALSRRNDEPERASRPFDLDRDGFVQGEGAGAVVLESEEHAKSRGATILAEVVGYGETCDAYHITAPRPDGSGAAGAMNAALLDADMAPGEVDYFNAHGTSTKYNENAEALALRAVFGEDMPPVNSTKSMIGHLLGAAGAVEAIACVKTIETGIMHPSINFDTPDPECIVNLIANKAQKKQVGVAMSNSLGFGGHNASIIIRRYE